MQPHLPTLIIILGILILIAALYPYREKIWNHVASQLITCLATMQGWLSSSKQDSSEKRSFECHFKSLAPTDDADKNGKYSEALKWAINEASIRNIAVTGPFGAGKTSVLKTFEKRNPDIKVLNISLASFSKGLSGKEPNHDAKEREDEKRQKEYLIEKSILQQIIYKETNKALPMSRFERLSKISTWHRWLKVVAFALSILLVLLFLKLDSETIADALKSIPELGFVYQLAILIIASIIIYGLVSSLRELLKNKRVNKISLLKGDIELSEKTGASILNLHIDEIIYFFEETDYQVVVFEDLDRFDGVEIFTKLREINTLLNQSKQLGNKKIVFIYAVKDDIFDEISRTKFFDFIVPVIPIVHLSNSREILREELRNSPYGTKISEEIVSNLTRYVDDMRLILNIFNEYIIYSEKLMKQIALTPDKLLAFIFYKNKYPRDFSLLNKGRGVVAEALGSKNRVIIELIKELDEKIKKCKLDIDIANDERQAEVAKNSKELRAIYLSKYIEQMQDQSVIRVGEENQNLSTLLNDESAFNKLIKSNRVYRIDRFGHRVKLDKLDSASYAERLAVIEGRTDEGLEKLNAKLKRLEQEKAKLRGQSLSFLLEHYPDKKAELLGKHADNELLSYLLVNSLIDESYYNYLSYFHPGSRTPQDKNFLIAVQEKKQLEFTYKLSSPKEVLEELTARELGSQYAVNIDLLDYMCSVSSQRLSEFLSGFEKFSKDDFEFVIAFYNTSNHGEMFIGMLSETWDSFISELLTNPNITEPNKVTLIKSVFQNSLPETIQNQNRDSVLTKFISKTRSTLLLELDKDTCIKVLEELKPKFINLELFIHSSELFEFIVNSDFYSLNSENIKCIFDYYDYSYEGSYPRFADITTTKIYRSIKNDLNSYVINVLIRQGEVIEETKDSIRVLLNSTELNIENKQKVIQRVKFRLEDISVVESDIETLWPQLLKYKKIKVSWQNVFNVYSQGEIASNQEELWKYLADEKVSEFLSEQDIPDTYLERAPDFFKSLIQTVSPKPKIIEKLIKELQININSLSDYKLSPDVAHVLVKAGVVTLTDENIQVLRDMSSNHVEDLLVENISEFCDSDSYRYLILSGDLERLLKNTDLSKETKLCIVDKYQDLFIGEEPLQVSAWDVIKEAGSPIYLDDNLVLEMTERLSTMSDKCLFLARQVGMRDWESLSNLFSHTGIESLQEIASRKQFIIMEKTKGEVELARALETYGHISSFSTSSVGDGAERIRINSKRK
jgi:YobI-like P-loop NTPase